MAESQIEVQRIDPPQGEPDERGAFAWFDACPPAAKPAVAGGVVVSIKVRTSLRDRTGFQPILRGPKSRPRSDSASGAHWLGTDTLGRDLFARLLYGGHIISIMVGLVATFVALVIGVAYGAVAGFVGGKADANDANCRHRSPPCPSPFSSSCSWYFLAEHLSLVFCHRGGRVADHGPDRARPGPVR